MAMAHELTLDLAEAAVRAARTKATELGTPVTVSVVNAGGRPVLMSKGDGTGFLNPAISRAKAVPRPAFAGRPATCTTTFRNSSCITTACRQS